MNQSKQQAQFSEVSPEIQKKAASARSALKRAKRVVVKVGTNVVMHPSGDLALGRLCSLIEEIVALKRQGREVILVTSGAIGLGSGRLGVTGDLLPRKQACAAVGQVLLMAVYEQAFSRFRVPVAQLLLTEEDFASRRRYLNLRNAVSELLTLGVLPIVNENDTVSTAEIEISGGRAGAFGDNDKLSALVMSKIDGEVLVLLTDVDGLYTAPGPRRGGKLIPVVAELDEELGRSARGPSRGGRGGMKTKLEAARICTASGGIAVIANGTMPGILGKLFSGEPVGTIFVPRRRLSGRKRWIAFASSPAGRVTVTNGARQALEERGASLLFAGVVKIEGDFERGDVVAICDEAGREFARGMANHGSDRARTLIGKHSKDVARITHEPNFDCFITRDNLVLVRR